MKFNVLQTDQKGLGLYAKETIPAYSVISGIKFIREVTKENSLAESEKHLQDHLHYRPDGARLKNCSKLKVSSHSKCQWKPWLPLTSEYR